MNQDGDISRFLSDTLEACVLCYACIFLMIRNVFLSSSDTCITKNLAIEFCLRKVGRYANISLLASGYGMLRFFCVASGSNIVIA